MRFLLSKLRIFLFFPIPYLSQPLFSVPAIVNLLVNSKIDSAEHTALRSEMKNKSSDSRLTMNPAQNTKKADITAF